MKKAIDAAVGTWRGMGTQGKRALEFVGICRSRFTRQSARAIAIESIAAAVVLSATATFLMYPRMAPAADPFGHDRVTCRIDDYGAERGDSDKTTEAFRAALADCAPGGTVVVPWGKWLTGPIRVPSDVTIRIGSFSTLAFDTDPSKYLPVVATRYEGMDVMNYAPLLYVPDATRVAIVGRGTFVGNGEPWWGWRKNGEKDSVKELYELSKAGVPIEGRVFGSPDRPLRPSFLQFYRSRDIVVDGPRFVDGPMWTVHLVYSRGVSIRDIEVDTTGPNTDGVAIDSSEDVVIERSRIGSGDDAIVIKSGLDYDGWKMNAASRHIVVRDVDIVRGNGGVTIGSEMSGGIEDVSVESSRFRDVDTGIRIKTVKGRGGYIRDIRYRDITMKDVVEDAIQVNARYKYSTVKSESGETSPIENLTFERIVVSGAEEAVRINGLDLRPVTGIVIRDSRFVGTRAGKLNDVRSVTLENVSISVRDDIPLRFENVQGIRLAGRAPLNDPFALFEGTGLRDIEVALDPCQDRSCIQVEKPDDVPDDAIRFES